jgi:predicted DNA-binding transcriptional regulator AlpA
VNILNAPEQREGAVKIRAKMMQSEQRLASHVGEPADRLIRFPEVERLTGVHGRPALRRLIRTRGFPSPIKFTGQRAVAWSLRAVEAWIEKLVAAA